MKHFLFRVQRAMEDNPANFVIVGFALIVIFLIMVFSIHSFMQEREKRRRKREK